MASLKIIQKLLHKLSVTPRFWKYQLLSDCRNMNGCPRKRQPVLFKGKGSIMIADSVTLGVQSSPYLYSGYMYLEARNKQSTIKISGKTFINNNCVLISEGDGIDIGSQCLIGYNVSIYDSDFHDLDPAKRIGGVPQMGKVTIADNVFIGANVTILRGVTVGTNSVIAAASVVSSSIPDNVIAGGNPAKVLREI